MERYNRPLRVYLSGPITGNQWYKRKFGRAEKYLTKRGYVVVNPAHTPEGLNRASYMPIDMAMIDACDYVYFLRGWQASAGARLERAYAEYQKKFIWEEGDAGDK